MPRWSDTWRPKAHGELLECLKRRGFTGRPVDRARRGGDGLAVFPTGIIQAVADQVHDAGLHRGTRVHHTNGLAQPLRAIDHGDQDVLAATGLEVVEHLRPELGALGLLDPKAQHIASTIGLHAQCQIDGFVANHAVAADLYA